jgi:hypothetical protein
LSDSTAIPGVVPARSLIVNPSHPPPLADKQAAGGFRVFNNAYRYETGWRGALLDNIMTPNDSGKLPISN